MLFLGILQAKKGSEAPSTPDYAAAATAQGAANDQAAMDTAAINRPTQNTPGGSLTWSLKPGADANHPQPGDWISTQTLSPGQQQIYNTDQSNQQALGGLASNAIANVGPTVGTAFDTSNLPSAVTQNISTDPNQFQAQADAASKAYYDKATSLYGSQFDQQKQALDASLANQGIGIGSDAYKAAMGNFQQNQNTAYQNQADTATQQGYALQSQQQQNLINAIQAQNASRSSAISQQASIRDLPLNEITSLMSGSQVQQPNFATGNSGTSVQAAPLFDATQASYNAALAQSNASNAGSQGLLGGLTSLGSAAIGAWG